MAVTSSTTVAADAVGPRPGTTSVPPVEPVSTRPATDLPDLVGVGADAVLAALAEAGSAGDRDDWARVAACCQSLVNTLAAVQDAAIVEVARRDQVWDEDGTLGEVVHARGRIALDAADLLAPALGASHPQAQRRVEAAVRIAGNRVPAEIDDRDLPEHSGLAELHTAMAVGDLDAFRASVVAHELELAPAEVADAVVAALAPHLRTDDAPALRKRTRQLLGRICPDLLRQRVERARASTGLRRWAAEPGVDEWHGTFPSEDAATAWAAIDRFAHDLLADGTCTTIEQARGKALTELVTSNATVDVQIVLTVPATDEHTAVAAHSASEPSAEHRDDDLVQVQGARPSEPLLVRRGWLLDQLTETPTTGSPLDPPRPRGRGGGPQHPNPTIAPCDPSTGARLDPHDDLATDAYRPSDALAALVRARDGRCRFPGCSVAARFCDLDHVRPWPTGPTTAANLLTLCRRHHRIKQRPGWSVRLHADGTTTWTDPMGRHRTTAPLDALATLVLSGAAVTAPPPAASGSLGDPGADDPRQTVLDEHRAARTRAHWANHRRCTSSRQLREAFARLHRRRLPDAPPF
jgi:hypothetical protein